MRQILALVAIAAAATAQNPGPAYADLAKAYEALKTLDYDAAIAGFERAVALEPSRSDIRKDLAYTLLKTGRNAPARDQFGEAMRLDPTDQAVALEYAFLSYETPDPVSFRIEARRIFERLARAGNATAATAFENVDRPLREGIERWSQVTLQTPDNFSAHEELARLAELRDDLDLASEHFTAALSLRPGRRDLLLDLGRVWQSQGRAVEANAALLAASRSPQPRVSEQAKALLPARYPYIYEFQNALAIDPANDDLRRELVYLHQAMGNPEAAEREARLLRSPLTELQRPGGPAPASAKFMADRSLEAGFLNDAARYLRAALEENPADFDAMLKLGQTYNNLRDDREAVRWFDQARQSPDARTASEAARAFRNLAPELRRVRYTVWALPLISTRWREVFAYAQAKAELRMPGWPVRPYVSARFVGDLRGRAPLLLPPSPSVGLAPQFLSERSVILAGGVATPVWRGATFWFEAGSAIPYQRGPVRAVQKDLRGGVSYAKAITRGHAFLETKDDALFFSRFGNDTLFYSQNRTGWSLNDALQLHWNWNATNDAKREYWANTVETGPGLRWRMAPFTISVDALRGAYLINKSNPFRPNYTDVRIGIWYAFTR